MLKLSPIVPSLGRVVPVRLIDGMGTIQDEAPALVNGVGVTGFIDATVFPLGLPPIAKLDLRYFQEDDVSELELTDNVGVWRWMPYQLANDPATKGANNPSPSNPG